MEPDVTTGELSPRTPTISEGHDTEKRHRKKNSTHRKTNHRSSSGNSINTSIKDYEDNDAKDGTSGGHHKRLELGEAKTIKRDRTRTSKSSHATEDDATLQQNLADLSPRRIDWIKGIVKENAQLRVQVLSEKEKNKQLQKEYSTLMAEFTNLKAQLAELRSVDSPTVSIFDSPIFGNKKHPASRENSGNSTSGMLSPRSSGVLLSPSPNPVRKQIGELEFKEEENGKRTITAGSQEALITKLIDPREVDLEFTIILLLMHRYFITPKELLEKLIKKYEALAEGTELERRRVLEVIKLWITSYGEDLWKEKPFVEVLLPFINSLPSTDTNDTSSRSLLFQFLKSFVLKMDEFVAKKEKENQSFRLFDAESSPFAGIVLRVNPTEFNLLQLDPTDLAKQMTLLDHQNFQGIPQSEWANKAYSKPSKSPNFHLMVSKFNQWSTWVTTEIMKRETPQQRAEMIGFFVLVAQACRDLNNFQGTYALVGGLNHSSLARMKMTWEKVKAKYLVKYRVLTDLFNIDQNFKTYRDALATSKPPLIPYIGIYPKFLIAIEDGIPDKTGEFINFNKLRMLFRQIQEIKAFQQTTYNMTVNPNLRALLRSVQGWSEDELFNASQKLEPGSKPRSKTIVK
eukprot:TRINITY_DN1388_c0_g1_i1.p1 TRINITY_DN1388_c0_g1~~TRINITY_DN1388_c0_g1_i1.p1  ORF type:complete len:628 (-),score=134.70 TRINITY_DN1388_c0_g1_i1:326-2209(-)